MIADERDLLDSLTELRARRRLAGGKNCPLQMVLDTSIAPSTIRNTPNPESFQFDAAGFSADEAPANGETDGSRG